MASKAGAFTASPLVAIVRDLGEDSLTILQMLNLIMSKPEVEGFLRSIENKGEKVKKQERFFLLCFSCLFLFFLWTWQWLGGQHTLTHRRLTFDFHFVLSSTFCQFLSFFSFFSARTGFDLCQNRFMLASRARASSRRCQTKGIERLMLAAACHYMMLPTGERPLSRRRRKIYDRYRYRRARAPSTSLLSLETPKTPRARSSQPQLSLTQNSQILRTRE